MEEEEIRVPIKRKGDIARPTQKGVKKMGREGK